MAIKESIMEIKHKIANIPTAIKEKELQNMKEKKAKLFLEKENLQARLIEINDEVEIADDYIKVFEHELTNLKK